MQNLPSHTVNHNALLANHLVVTSPANVAPSRASLPSFVMVIYVIIGVPLLFAVNTLREEAAGSYLPLSLLVVFIVLAFLNLRELLRRRVQRFYFLCFVVLLFATGLALLATNPYAERAQLTSLLAFFAWSSIFISIYHLTSDYRVYQFAMRMLDLLGIGLALSVFMSFIGPEYLGFSFGEVKYTTITRAFGPFGDQVGFALGYFALRSLMRQKWLTAILCIGAILFTGTRGAVISVAVGVIWAIINLPRSIRDKRSSFRVVGTLVVISIAVVAYLVIFQGGVISRFEEVLLDDDSLLQRRNSIELGVRVFADNPVFGVGYLGFNRLIDQYSFVQYFEMGSDVVRGTYTAQNQYLQTATDAGLVGLAVVLLFLGVMWGELQRASQIVTGKQMIDLLSTSAWLVAMCLGNLAAVWLVPMAISSYVFFLVTGLTLGLIRLQERGLVPMEIVATNRDFRLPEQVR